MHLFTLSGSDRLNLCVYGTDPFFFFFPERKIRRIEITSEEVNTRIPMDIDQCPERRKEMEKEKQKSFLLSTGIEKGSIGCILINSVQERKEEFGSI
ncbi:hypothetical protein CEXT_448281 [Caerostris extrusa]|uniref:Uncharacterized protein n=1 Tax=Caerostris extrusa TaxID=172846 RepID=A0AAV4QV60_CAEEX|nr:hypothetical protein CEXT_448281 [Caerostris extrusa]